MSSATERYGKSYNVVEPPTNQDPFFVNESDTNYVNIKWNSQYSTEIIGADNDLDSLSMDYFIIPDKPEMTLKIMELLLIHLRVGQINFFFKY